MKYNLPVFKVSLIRDGNLESNVNEITQPSDVLQLLTPYMQGLDREHFVVVLLNTKHHVLGLNTVSIGCLNSSTVHPREVFKPAILANAASIIVAHNHPSGNPEPSTDDIRTTNRLIEAGKIIGINVLDHIVTGSDGNYVSLKQRGFIET